MKNHSENLLVHKILSQIQFLQGTVLLLFFVNCFFIAPINAQQNCLHYDGRNDFVQVTSPFQGDEDFTIEAWVLSENKKECASGKYLRVIGWRGYNMEIAVCGESLRFYDGAAWKSINNAKIVDNKWHHIAVVRKKPNYTIYLDGGEVLSYQNNRAKSMSGYFSIGSAISTEGREAEFWEGMIDEVRIWSKPRTAEEIRNFMGLELLGGQDSLVALFHFNQGIPEGENPKEEYAVNSIVDGSHGKLKNFTLTGSISNFIYSTVPIQTIQFGAEYLRPKLLNPGNGRTINPKFQKTVKFSWEGITRGTSYIFQIFEQSPEDSISGLLDEKGPVITRKVDSQNYIELSTMEEALKEGYLYLWKVDAIDYEGNPLCSESCSSNTHVFSILGIDCGIEITNLTIECKDPFFVDGKMNYKGCITFTNSSSSQLTFKGSSSGLYLFNSSSQPISGLLNTSLFPSALSPGNSATICFELSVTQSSVRLQIVADDVDPDPLKECIAKDAINTSLPFCICDECESDFIVSASHTATIEKSNSPDFDWLHIKALVKGSNPVIKIQAELAFLQIIPANEQCLLCSKDNRQYGHFVEPGPYNELFHPSNPSIYNQFKSKNGKIVSGDGSTTGRLVQWETAGSAGANIWNGIFLELGLGIPKLPDLHCCGYKIVVCIRYTLKDEECRVCDKLACVGIFVGENSSGDNGSAGGSSNANR